MKKLLMLLAVIAMAAPVLATSIEFTATDGTISYVVTDGTVRGMALNVDADAALTDVAVDSFFDVFMDAAFGDPENYALGDGTPIASQDVAGEIALPSASFCISMGNLEGVQDVDEIVLTGDAGTTGTIDINTLRGGIVDTDGVAVTHNLPITFELAGGEVCRDKFTGTMQEDYDAYVALGVDPSCWCWQFQCHGDTDNQTETFFKYRVYIADLNSIVENWKKKITDPTIDPCADIDHASETFFKYRVYIADLNTVVANWKAKDTGLTDCDSYIAQ